MDRAKAIDILYEIGKTIADEWNLTEVEICDNFCGIWDMGERKLSDILKKKYGDMKEVVFHNGKKEKGKGRYDRQVECGYRFSNPQLIASYRRDDGIEVLAKLELSESNGPGYEKTGDYKMCECMFWQEEGFELQKRILDMWEKNSSS